jgi:signal recognition particle subunit SRP54
MLDRLSTRLSDIIRHVSGQGSISEKNIQDTVEEIKVALLEADVNLRVVRRFVNQTIEEAKGETVLRSVNPGQQFVKIIHDKLVHFLGDDRTELRLKGPDTVSVVLMMGLQGSGKTTTCAKLATRLKKENRVPLLVAADLIRPAAIQQLQVLGDRIGVDVFSEDTQDSVSLVRNAISFAKREQRDTVIVDTTGRMNIDEPMMQELKKLHKACEPVETLLVADAMTGQNAVSIAKGFGEYVELTGIILSKFDSDTRGGAALSLKSITGKPILYIGTGENIEDLDPFFPDRIASRILGMGDVVSLVEKAQETIDREEAVQLRRKMQSATFTLEDYLDQFRRVRKMGSIQSLIEMIPGAQGAVSEDDIDETEMIREEAIILSMTPQERKNHRILNPSRRKRVAKGSGTSVYDVNRLLKKFDKMKLMMKKMTKNKKYQSRMLAGMGG